MGEWIDRAWKLMRRGRGDDGFLRRSSGSAPSSSTGSSWWNSCVNSQECRRRARRRLRLRSWRPSSPFRACGRCGGARSRPSLTRRAPPRTRETAARPAANGQQRDVLFTFDRPVTGSAGIADTLVTDVRDLQPAWHTRAGAPRTDSAADALIAGLPASPVVDLAAARTLTEASAKSTLAAIDRLVGAGVLRERTPRPASRPGLGGRRPVRPADGAEEQVATPRPTTATTDSGTAPGS